MDSIGKRKFVRALFGRYGVEVWRELFGTSCEVDLNKCEKYEEGK